MLADLKFCKQHDVPLDANDGKRESLPNEMTMFWMMMGYSEGADGDHVVTPWRTLCLLSCSSVDGNGVTAKSGPASVSPDLQSL